MEKKTVDEEKGGVPALLKGFAILDLLANEPGLGFAAIQRRLDLPKSSCHLLIATLCRLGAIQSQADRGYVLGLRLFELGALAANQRPIDREAQPLLRRLAQEVHLTCHLGVREGLKAVYLAKVECEREIMINTWVGKRISLHSSSLGKVLLAWLPEAELEEILQHLDWTRKCPNTLTEPQAFKAHLAEVRRRGWAIDDQEDIQNIRCLAAPVTNAQGEVIAALSIVGTVLELGADRFEELAGRVCAVAREISQALGHRP
ncbi:IclR family transcriptional regulator [Telmatospirillum siberiense]|uniref:IclR family transcriptional regulator n=1 Tax=Telmatospirillum siberiense TaxID=382514 RepID=A0A2N3PSZ9_9PROT|nr:IclR family transcriptional regulator [Telmatospirillum siberiense]PKU23517.1 IclR family transcriptional regulator [Telmatospirillum siberiense]